ncbi:MAG: ubiquinone biosynthesis protein Coq4 [Halioglobus sp.]|jgi:ubiquinone biosynthesis protein Coq4
MTSAREMIQKATRRADGQVIAEAVAQAKLGKSNGRLQLAAVMAWVAYSCPAASEAVYDNICSCWLGTGPTPDIPMGLPEAPLEDSFWQAFWTVVDGPEGGYDAITVTVAVSELADAVHPDYEKFAEQHAAGFEGSAISVSSPIPGHTDFDELARCPEKSLGKSLYNMIVENGYDPEVLDRESIKLSAMPHSLHYLNARILQMHDVWHLVAGYETTSSNEIAISAFQLAQFGHNYSAMFLAVGMAMSITQEPRGFSIIMQIVAEAWQHGRETPFMMNIEWEKEWNNSLKDIRATHGIRTYKSVFPTDMLETVESAPVWKKLTLSYPLLKYHFLLRRTNDFPRAAMQ